MWYRLAVDVRPGGEVIGVSWERHDDDGACNRISTVPGTLDYRYSLGRAVELAWRDVNEREGLVPFP